MTSENKTTNEHNSYLTVNILCSKEEFVPKRATKSAAGFDLVTSETVHVPPGTAFKIPTGVRLEIPEGYHAEIKSRSSTIFKTCLLVINGVIDSDYRGELMISVFNTAEHTQVVLEGARIAQIVFYKTPNIEFDKVSKLVTDTVRGKNGFGSTGD